LRQSWKHEVRDGDNALGQWHERDELGQDGDLAKEFRPPELSGGIKEAWVSDSVYFAPGFQAPGTWCTFEQWKDQNPDLGSPSFGMNVKNGRVEFSGLVDGTGSPVVWWSEPLQTGVWYNFVWYFKFRTDNTGRVEFYESTGKNAPVLKYSATKRTYRVGGSGQVMVPRQAYYRDPSKSEGTQAIYHTGWMVGTTRDTVSPF
jgi:hypothetical protein